MLVELNTDFSTKGLSAQESQAIVAAWQANTISRDTMTELFRRGEVLPEERTNEEEEKLISTGVRAGRYGISSNLPGKLKSRSVVELTGMIHLQVLPARYCTVT